MDFRIEAVLKLIARDIRSPLRPSWLANRAGLSVSRFYELFRKSTGTGPAQYIRKYRFERAKELLLTTNFSVKEIANHTGIHDNSHFVRDFEKFYGMSPRGFRRAHGNGISASPEM
jgi:transcriptional regulator GlxA family with amidase domain